MTMLDHETYMRRAIELSARVPARPFGAVIVDGERGEVVAEGWNQSELNPVWHGEVVALHALNARRDTVDPETLVLYTTAEPCPMCQGAILWTGIGHVVFGTSIQTLMQLGWRQIDISAEEVTRRAAGWPCTITGGVLERECDALFRAAIVG